MDRIQTFDGDFVFGINVNLFSGILKVMSDDTDAIRMDFGDLDEEDESVTVDFSQGMLNISQHGRLPFGLLPSGQIHLTIAIPREWKGAYDLRVRNGSICVEEISGTDIVIQTAKAPVQARNVTAIDLQMKSLTGELNICQAEGERAAMRTLTGSMNAARMSFERYEAQSLNGDLSVELSKPFAEMRCRTWNGQQKISVPMERIYLMFRTRCGRIRTDKVSIAENAPLLTAKSFSGTINIQNSKQD